MLSHCRGERGQADSNEEQIQRWDVATQLGNVGDVSEMQIEEVSELVEVGGSRNGGGVNQIGGGVDWIGRQWSRSR
jgi:hypothetical protein